MSRYTLTLAAMLLSAPAAAQVVASTPSAPPQRPELTTHRLADVTTFGLRFDVGSAYAYGVGMLRVRERGEFRRGLGGSVWWGGGVDLRALSVEGDTLDAVQVSAVGRMSFLGCSGAGIEATLGVATGLGDRANAHDPAVVLTGSLGAFMGIHWFLVGYSYQVPIAPFERPDWLASHQFSVRLEVPVHRSGERVWQTP